MVPISDAEATEIVKLFQSSIGKKLLTGLTGLGLVTFVVIHLLGNLTLFFSAEAYNQLAYVIERLGPLTYAFELGLAAIALLHATIGITIYLGKRRARPIGYSQYASAGEPSRQTLSSRTMIISGLVLGIFLIVHLATFKFGTYYALPGSGHRDLARLVFETFHNPLHTAAYVGVLGLLGLHLRHGLWSALQSVGLETRPVVYGASAVLGGAIALGFIGLPLAIYFDLIG
ncbi:MAG: succinate dehydrogenase [Phormidesmis sp. RL_2_1]|nr:succinate dehydrogenase [Phormidesmis sp. RL_2_1]